MAIEPAVPAAPAKSAEWIGHRERGSAALLRFMAFLSLRLGRKLAIAVPLYGIALYFFLFAPGARRQSRRYLRRALGRTPRARERFRHVLNFATTIHDRVYLINEQYDAFSITIEGESLMREQVQRGHGAFLMGAHTGQFRSDREHRAPRQAGLQVSMAMYEDNARKINAILAAINPNAKPDIISLGHIDARCSRRPNGSTATPSSNILGRPDALGEEPVHAVSIPRVSARLPAHGTHACRRPLAPIGHLPLVGPVSRRAMRTITWCCSEPVARTFPRAHAQDPR